MSCSTRLTSSAADPVLAAPLPAAELPPVPLLSHAAIPTHNAAASAAFARSSFVIVYSPLRIEDAARKTLARLLASPLRPRNDPCAAAARPLCDPCRRRLCDGKEARGFPARRSP